MYTVVFANLPHSTKHYDRLELSEEDEATDEEKVEEVIREHINKVLKKKVHIADIMVAFNNEDEIRLSKERGNHIKEKTKLVNVSNIIAGLPKLMLSIGISCETEYGRHRGTT